MNTRGLPIPGENSKTQLPFDPAIDRSIFFARVVRITLVGLRTAMILFGGQMKMALIRDRTLAKVW